MSTSVDATVAAAVHNAIAAYAHALDAGRMDEVVELFWPDGVADLAGIGVFEGREAIRAAYAGFAPTRPQLHLMANTVITSWTEREATAASSLVFFRFGSSGWAARMVGRYEDTLQCRDGAWRFQRRVATFLPQ